MEWIRKLVSLSRQPYPFYYRGKGFLLFIAIIFLMSLGFNYLFRPFDVHVPEHKMDYFWISVIHSTTTILIALLLFPFTRLGGPKIEEKWTVGREVLLVAVYLFLIGAVQFLIRDVIYDNPDNWSWRYFFEEIRNTFLVGLLLISILISINYNRLNGQNMKKARTLEISGERDEREVFPSKCYIRTDVKGDDFEMDVSRFLFAKAEGNYVDIYIGKDAGVERLIKRISIKNLESQLTSMPYILRTHRSYLVNLHYVRNITGNAQGYRLGFRELDEMALVSRNMIPSFEEKYKAH